MDLEALDSFPRSSVLIHSNFILKFGVSMLARQFNETKLRREELIPGFNFNFARNFLPMENKY